VQKEARRAFPGLPRVKIRAHLKKVALSAASKKVEIHAHVLMQPSTEPAINQCSLIGRL
jgi:hypothetical protein